jgi:hypothetical protein
MTIFVRGGENVETLVPLGSYYVRYASGTTWYGHDHLFGDYHTGYSKGRRGVQLHGGWRHGQSFLHHTLYGGGAAI